MHLTHLRRLVSVSLLATVAISTARAQATGVHPNFAGLWEMDTAKSQPGPMTPMAMTYTIEQRGDTIKIIRYTKSMRGEFTSNLTYGTDGKPWKNSVPQGGMMVDVSSVLTWEGATLVITSVLDAGGQQINQVEKWSLDASGKSLLADRTVDAMGQQFTMKLVLTKRP